MADLNVTHDIVVGDQRSAAKLQQNFVDIESKFNGNIQTSNVADFQMTADKVAAAAAVNLGLSQTGTVRRGKSIITTEEARTNVAYGTLTTPDRVQNVVLPTDGLIAVAYQATVKNSVSSAGRAALFIGANQLKAATGALLSGPAVQETTINSAADTYNVVASTGLGINAFSDATAWAGDVTTGQLVAPRSGGGPFYIFAAAGTYDISVQFKSTSGSVTAKNRSLWVWTMGF